MNNDIGYIVVDFMIKLILFAGISAVLLLLGAAVCVAITIIKRRKNK